MLTILLLWAIPLAFVIGLFVGIWATGDDWKNGYDACAEDVERDNVDALIRHVEGICREAAGR